MYIPTLFMIVMILVPFIALVYVMMHPRPEICPMKNCKNLASFLTLNEDKYLLDGNVDPSKLRTLLDLYYKKYEPYTFRPPYGTIPIKQE